MPTASLPKGFIIGFDVNGLEDPEGECLAGHTLDRQLEVGVGRVVRQLDLQAPGTQPIDGLQLEATVRHFDRFAGHGSEVVTHQDHGISRSRSLRR